jgi:hypothetical protein
LNPEEGAVKNFAIALVLCLSAVNGFSQCQTTRVSAHKEMQMASSVIVGTVIAAQPVPEAWDFLDGVNYTVRVDSKIRGKVRPNTEVTVFSENSPRFFAMYVGQQYVLYLQPQYGRNQVDNCGNSHSLDETPATATTTSLKLPKQITASRGF